MTVKFSKDFSILKMMLKNDLEDFVMLKAYRNNALSEEDKEFNKKVSRMKYMRSDLFRRVGLKRAKQHNAFCNLTYNMDRYTFLVR